MTCAPVYTIKAVHEPASPLIYKWTGIVLRDGEPLVYAWGQPDERTALRTADAYRCGWLKQATRTVIVTLEDELPPSYTLFDQQMEDDAIRDALV